MLTYLADEDLNNRIIRGLIRRHPQLDIIRVQDTVISGAADPDVLEWAHQNGRVLLTHDISTMTKFTAARFRAGQTTAGVIEIPQSMSVGQAIEELLLIATVCQPEEFENRVEYLPI